MGYVELITAFFKFFPEVRKLLVMLQKTPQERHAELMTKMQAESDSMAKTGRPTWEVK